MGRKIIVLLMVICVTLLYSCNNKGVHKEGKEIVVQNKILQQEDGTISLNFEKAECYSDMVNPSSNTAEWSVVVSKSGRFNVWLSSATTDTTDLQYKNSVMLSILDNRLETRPECDKIITNSSEVTFPYFRADSFMGSLYIQDTGIYNIQLVSEKIIPHNYKAKESGENSNTKLLSVFLTPITR
jgi:hypothetical protein